MNRMILLVSIILILVSSACTPAVRYTPDLVFGPECEMPCWYGIEPGKTSEQEMEKLLSTIPFVNGQEIKKTTQENGVTRYYWLASKNIVYETGEIYVKDGITQIIKIFWTGDLITISDAIDRYGAPVYLQTRSSCGERCTIAISGINDKVGYISKSVLDKVFVREGEPLEVHGGMRVNTLEFFPRNGIPVLIDVGGRRWMENMNLRSVHPWTGYGIYKISNDLNLSD